MKSHLFIFIMLSQCIVYSQDLQYFVDFESPIHDYRISIYTDSNNSNNLWQIGIPNKSYFNRTDTVSNVLITDTINSYPPNTHSTFFVEIPTHDSFNIGYKLYFMWFSFSYRIDSDTLKDFGKLEMSINDGKSYFEPTKDSSFIFELYNGPYTGRSKWNVCDVMMLGFPNYFHEQNPDKISFKFTFHSDSWVEVKDGWMIDDLFYKKMYSLGISKIVDTSNPLVFPTIVSDYLYIDEELNHKKIEIDIIDLEGRLVKKVKFENVRGKIDISELYSGYYLIIINKDGRKFVQKILKN